MRIGLKARSGKETYHDLDVPYPPTPAGIIDAINRYFKDGYTGRSSGAAAYRGYDRIFFDWQHNEINLTNPAHNGQDPHPYYGKYTAGYDKTKQFLDAYYDQQPQTQPEKQQEKQQEQPKYDPEYGELIKPDSVYTGETLVPPGANKPKPLDWQTRWHNMLDRSARIAKQDADRDARRKAYSDQADKAYKDAMESVKSIIDVPQAILRILMQLGDTFVWTARMIPEEIQAAVERFSNNIDFLRLSFERLWTIANGLLSYVSKTYDLLNKLDWDGATKMLNQMIDEQRKAMEYGMQQGIITDTGVAGYEHWQTPLTPPNSAEELRHYQAMAVLAESPFVGASVRSQMRFWMLQHYQEQTGVGIPDRNAWYKYILDTQIGTSVPIQEATDLAGTVPDWFLGKTRDFEKISHEIHDKSHEELKTLKK